MVREKIIAVLWKNSLFYKQTCYWFIVIFLPISCLILFRILEFLNKYEVDLDKIGYYTTVCNELKCYDLNLTDVTPNIETFLLYAPANDLTKKLIDNVEEKKLINNILGFENEEELLKGFNELFHSHERVRSKQFDLENVKLHSKKFFGVWFSNMDNATDWPVNFTYNILSSTSHLSQKYTDIISNVWMDKAAFPSIDFLPDTALLQLLIDNAFISIVTGSDDYFGSERFRFGHFPIKKYFKTGSTTPIFFINFLRSCIIIYKISSIVRDEKESGLKEFIVVAGVSSCRQELCLFVIFYLPISVSTIIESILMAGWYDFVSSILLVTNIYLVISIYAAILIGNIGNTSFSVIYCILIWITFGFLQYLSISYKVKSNCQIELTNIFDLILLLLPANCYYTILYYVDVLSRIAAQNDHFYDFLTHNVPSITPSFNVLLLFFLTSALVTLSLLWYVQNVFTGDYGRPKKWYFFITKKYWSEIFRGKREADRCYPLPYETGIEPPMSRSRPVICLRNVIKFYGKEEAIKGINLDIYKNTLTVILGHNGAGKSTMLHMIAGLIEPTSGYIFSSIKKDSVGFCSALNIFFPRMTPFQHIKFFAMLRGSSYWTAHEDAKSILEYLKVDSMYYERMINNLSLGIKRKISIAMALVGSNKLLILDEPTAGLDYLTNIEIWKALANQRNQTILIATQNSREAEIFSDRILILHDGNLLCYGTIGFLKNYYDTGYVLNIYINSVSYPNKLLNIIKKYIPNSKIKYVLSKRVSVFFSRTDNKFIINLIKDLEEKKKKLQIDHFDINKMNLEDIFLKSGGYKLHVKKSVLNPVADFDRPAVKGFKLYCYQIVALIFKQLLQMYSQWIMILNLLVFSILVSSFSAYTAITYLKETKSVAVSLSLYNNSYILDNIGGFSEVIKSISNTSFVHINSTNMLEDINYYLKNSPVLYHLKFIIGFLYGRCLILRWNAVYSPFIGINILSNYVLNKRKLNTPYRIYMNIVTSAVRNSRTYHVEVINVMVTFIVSIVLLQIHSEEYSSGVRKLQILSGIPKSLYWFATYVLDCLFFMTTNCIVYMIKWIFTGTQISYFMLLEFLNLNVLLPLIYCLSTLKINTGIVILMFFLIVPQYIYTFIHTNKHFLPIYLAWIPGLTKSIACYINTLKQADDMDEQLTIRDSIFINIILTQSFIMWLFFIFVDNSLCEYIFYRQSDLDFKMEHEDDDVRYEESGCRRLVKYLEDPKNVDRLRSDLFVYRLMKYYQSPMRKEPVIKDMTFATEIGTIFGILGENGSGKSTLIQMLVGDMYPNSGDIYILKKKMSFWHELKAKSCIGYCPENHTLLKTLTGKQMLWIMAIIKGIAIRKVHLVAQWWLDRTDMHEHGSKKIKLYTPGMKKRLNMAIALMANMPVLILDEPTEGIDPGGKGLIRKIISRSKSSTRTIFITTQSIEECESLCDKITILSEGNIKCIGNLDYLKSKYSNGYTVKLEISPDTIDESIDEISRNIPEEFECELENRTSMFILYNIRNKTIEMSKIFEVFHDLKNEYSFIIEIFINNYIIEDLFISLKPDNSKNNE